MLYVCYIVERLKAEDACSVFFDAVAAYAYQPWMYLTLHDSAQFKPVYWYAWTGAGV